MILDHGMKDLTRPQLDPPAILQHLDRSKVTSTVSHTMQTLSRVMWTFEGWSTCVHDLKRYRVLNIANKTLCLYHSQKPTFLRRNEDIFSEAELQITKRSRWRCKDVVFRQRSASRFDMSIMDGGRPTCDASRLEVNTLRSTSTWSWTLQGLKRLEAKKDSSNSRLSQVKVAIHTSAFRSQPFEGQY